MKHDFNPRGVGFLAALTTAATVGLADGVATIVQAPASVRAAGLPAWLVFHSFAVLTVVGIAAGFLQELLFQSAARRAALRSLGRWALAGPRKWFARDVRAALRLAWSALTLGSAVSLLVPVTWHIINAFHSRFLMATAVPLAVLGLLLCCGAASLLLIWPLGLLLGRVRFLASPGAVVLISLVAIGVQVVHFVARNWEVFRNLNGAIAIGAVGALLLDLIVLALFARWRRGRAPVRWRALAATVGSVAGVFLLSGLTFGLKQSVASALLLHSAAAKYVVHSLQGVVDWDRDGYGVLFGGGDCNDRDARVHPGALDVPGNGVDENCSGRDAVRVTESGDGRYVTPAPALSRTKPNILFVSIDTMRPDHTSAYGYARPTTPNLAKFARGAAQFHRAYCTSPRSLRSFASVFTGLYPSMIVWEQDNQYPPLALENLTLAEALVQRGYETVAFANTSYFTNVANYYQGFQNTHVSRGYIDDEGPTTREAVRWISERRGKPQPYFAWVHLMNPHDPYGDRTLPKDFGHSEVDKYDEQIAAADEAFAHILSAAEQLEREGGAPTLVFVFSDHGEGMGEHGVYHHSYDAHEEALRVALFVRGPGVVPGRRDVLTSLFDLFPTVLNAVGEPLPRPVPSRSLLAVLQSPETPQMRAAWRQELFAEIVPDGRIPVEMKVLLGTPWKVIYDLQNNTWELYDLVRDPGEKRNLYDSEPSVAGALRTRLWTWIESSGMTSNRTADLIEQNRLAGEPAIQHRARARFGNVLELLGFDLSRTRFRVGDVIDFPAYFRVLGRTVDPMFVGVYFERLEGGGVPWNFWTAHYPIFGRYLTTEWRPGELLRDPMVLRIQPDFPPGHYRLLFAVEGKDRTGRVFPDHDAQQDGTFALGEIEIEP